MELYVNDKEKTVEIWMNQSERENGDLQNRLKAIFADYKRNKFFVAIFYSGGRNLLECTTGLLLHNRKVAAQRDVALATADAAAR